MNRFLKMTSLAALCALLAVPAGAGAARGDFDLRYVVEIGSGPCHL